VWSGLTATLNGTATLEMPPEHCPEGAHFNRFGIISTQIDGNYHFIYFDDLEYTWKQD
jgi:hypothetical protein